MPYLPSRTGLLSSTLLALLLTASARADAPACQGVTIDAGSATSEQTLQAVRRVCAQVQQFFARCGIAQLRPLHIRVVPQLDPPSRLPMLGCFDAPAEEISLLDHDHFAASIPPDTAYALLPSRELHASLTAHEVAHAIVTPHLPQQGISRTAQEYVAAVVQLSSLGEASRQRLLDAYPRDTPVPLAGLNGFTLHADPQWFVVNAYRHFAAAPDRCALLRGILAGRIRLYDNID